MKRCEKLSLELFENTLSSQPEPDNRERRRILRALKKAVQGELTKRQMDCVVLYYGGEKTEEEVALRLGITKPTVSKHLKKARVHLSRVLTYYFSS